MLAGAVETTTPLIANGSALVGTIHVCVLDVDPSDNTNRTEYEVSVAFEATLMQLSLGTIATEKLPPVKGTYCVRAATKLPLDVQDEDRVMYAAPDAGWP